MFGYVKPDRRELLVKDDEFYRATYCGICRTMKKETGVFSPAFLTYDSVFLALVRMLFVEDGDIGTRCVRCPVHPLHRKTMLRSNPALVYTARAFASLAYYRAEDNLHDEKFFHSLGVRFSLPLLSYGRDRADMRPLDDIIRKDLADIRKMEADACPSVDLPAEKFGHLLGAVFSFGLAGDGEVLTRTAGYHLGKFIYGADAAEDYGKDRTSGAYNPYVSAYGGRDLTCEDREAIHTALLLEADGLGQAVELFPYGKRHTLERLIKNITYRGLEKRIRFLKEETE